jgi:hypothetical protein
MAWQILATHTIDWVQWDVQKIYQAPADSGITDGKLIINNYSPDNIVVYSVWAPWWEIVWNDLNWIWWALVSEAERKQRALFRGELKQYDSEVIDWLLLWDEDQIRAEWKSWICNVVLFGDLNSTAARVEELKGKVLLWTITVWEKEELMLLSWWAYVIQNNTNNCSCA